MKSSVVTVCIPTYNQSRFLRQAVESALSQKGCDVEVLVADDHSTDDTPSVMGTYAKDRRVHYHRQPANLGIAGNAGWLLEQPKTEFLARLDSDDVLEPNFCTKLIQELDRHPHAGVAHAAVRQIDQEGREGRLRLLRRPAGFQCSDDALREGVNGYRVAANLCLFRKAALAQIAPVYRAGLNFAEDWDLFCRLSASGWGNVYVPEILGKYRVWADELGVRARRKHSELTGIKSVICDTIVPEWGKRNWPDRELEMARRGLACAHSVVLVSAQWSEADRAEIVADLRSISPNDEVLERKIRFYLSNAGRLAARFGPLKLVTKDAIKRILRQFR